MHGVWRVYSAALRALAVLASALLAAILISIIFDVTIRNLGGQPPAWTLPMVEYGLLYLTMLAAPWLVRTRGHIVVEALTSVMPRPVRRVMEYITYTGCIVICVLFAWYAADLFIESYQRGETDIRSIEIPRVFLFAPMVVSFVLMAIEFIRYLVGPDSLYTGKIGEQDGV